MRDGKYKAWLYLDYRLKTSRCHCWDLLLRLPSSYRGFWCHSEILNYKLLNYWLSFLVLPQDPTSISSTWCILIVFLQREVLIRLNVAQRTMLSHVNSNKRMVTILMKILSYLDWSIKWWCSFSYSWDPHWYLLCQLGVLPAIGNGHQTQGLSGIAVELQRLIRMDNLCDLTFNHCLLFMITKMAATLPESSWEYRNSA